MNLTKIFDSVLNAQYTHLDAETASFAYEKDGDKLHIYFEWSNGKRDWFNNLDFPAKPYRDMENLWYAHRGFLRVWKVIEPHLADVIADTEVKEIEIAGYSHGAAIALLCHEYCKFNRPDCHILGYGFGGPRVVWGRFNHTVAKRFEGFTLIRNGRDLVTRVPPVLFGYRHVGQMLDIDPFKSYGPIESHYPDKYHDMLVLYDELYNDAEEILQCHNS